MTIVPTNPESETDAALAEIERAIKQFEQIILRRLSKTGRRSSSTRAGITVAKNLIDLISGDRIPTRSPDFNPNAGKNNRFPSSNGQIFADIAGLLRTLGGRNL